jgi:hypothetical protein
VIVGFSGHAQSGKDTAADHLVAHGWQKRAIADPIKRIALAYPLVESVVNEVGWEEAKKVEWIRPLLQRIGAAIREEFGEDYLISRIFGTYEMDRGLVITDVRTERERCLVKLWNGVVIRITRPGVGPANGDVTEQVIGCDYEIVNDGSIEDLHAKLDAVLKEIGGV